MPRKEEQEYDPFFVGDPEMEGQRTPDTEVDPCVAAARNEMAQLCQGARDLLHKSLDKRKKKRTASGKAAKARERDRNESDWATRAYLQIEEIIQDYCDHAERTWKIRLKPDNPKLSWFEILYGYHWGKHADPVRQRGRRDLYQIFAMLILLRCGNAQVSLTRTGRLDKGTEMALRDARDALEFARGLQEGLGRPGEFTRLTENKSLRRSEAARANASKRHAAMKLYHDKLLALARSLWAKHPEANLHQIAWDLVTGKGGGVLREQDALEPGTVYRYLLRHADEIRPTPQPSCE